MTVILPTGAAETAAQLSVYNDFTDLEFNEELGRIMTETAIEREWMQAARAIPFESDKEILDAYADEKLVRVTRGTGFVAIQKLLQWDTTRSNPKHPYYYSPPFLGPDAYAYLTDLAEHWQSELGSSRLLSVTSLVRSDQYQAELATRPRKITVVSPDLSSSNTVGWSCDVDGCGLYEQKDNGEVQAIKPR